MPIPVAGIKRHTFIPDWELGEEPLQATQHLPELVTDLLLCGGCRLCVLCVWGGGGTKDRLNLKQQWFCEGKINVLVWTSFLVLLTVYSTIVFKPSC